MLSLQAASLGCNLVPPERFRGHLCDPPLDGGLKIRCCGSFSMFVHCVSDAKAVRLTVLADTWSLPALDQDDSVTSVCQNATLCELASAPRVSNYQF